MYYSSTRQKHETLIHYSNPTPISLLFYAMEEKFCSIHMWNENVTKTAARATNEK
jgi:hypothetical protein